MKGPSDWRCPNVACLNHQKMVFGSRSHCPKCGASKQDTGPSSNSGILGGAPSSGGVVGVGSVSVGGISGSPSSSLGRPSMSQRLQASDVSDDWACPNKGCINSTRMVFGKKTSCPACGSARSAKTPGDWLCPNGACINSRNTVFASKVVCPKCGSPRPGGAVVNSFSPSGGGCLGGCFGGCGGCGCGGGVFMSQAPPPMMMPQPVLSGLPSAFAAPFAGANLGPLLGVFDGGNGRPQAVNGKLGDWKCPNTSCMNNRKMVFAKHTTCPQCGTPRGGSGAGNNPGDWQCPNSSCMNHRNQVFAKHAKCPACGTLNPGLDEIGSFRSSGRSRSPHGRR
eukprot:TRINITY_DN63973_c0_g1_i1.p1 TRINITY_DN63973_c0_g1~~TRINITY_DN63973_c0_g1_i1.p1  ORF type:complete len:337 (+),score=61.11 TRINITY_DN63973_c0_g1_i1:83-1093(+)